MLFIGNYPAEENGKCSIPELPPQKGGLLPRRQFVLLSTERTLLSISKGEKELDSKKISKSGKPERRNRIFLVDGRGRGARTVCIIVSSSGRSEGAMLTPPIGAEKSKKKKRE